MVSKFETVKNIVEKKKKLVVGKSDDLSHA